MTKKFLNLNNKLDQQKVNHAKTHIKKVEDLNKAISFAVFLIGSLWVFGLTVGLLIAFSSPVQAEELQNKINEHKEFVKNSNKLNKEAFKSIKVTCRYDKLVIKVTNVSNDGFDISSNDPKPHCKGE